MSGGSYSSIHLLPQTNRAGNVFYFVSVNNATANDRIWRTRGLAREILINSLAIIGDLPYGAEQHTEFPNVSFT